MKKHGVILSIVLMMQCSALLQAADTFIAQIKDMKKSEADLSKIITDQVLHTRLNDDDKDNLLKVAAEYGLNILVAGTLATYSPSDAVISSALYNVLTFKDNIFTRTRPGKLLGNLAGGKWDEAVDPVAVFNTLIQSKNRKSVLIKNYNNWFDLVLKLAPVTFNLNERTHLARFNLIKTIAEVVDSPSATKADVHSWLSKIKSISINDRITLLPMFTKLLQHNQTIIDLAMVKALMLYFVPADLMRRVSDNPNQFNNYFQNLLSMINILPVDGKLANGIAVHQFEMMQKSKDQKLDVFKPLAALILESLDKRGANVKKPELPATLNALNSSLTTLADVLKK